MAHPRIVILSNPDENGSFQYRMAVTFPSDRVVIKHGVFPGPLPVGSAAQVKQAVKDMLQEAWQNFKDAAKDVSIQGGTWDENGNWSL